MTSYYDVGTKAWQPDQAEGWVASEVTQKKVDGERVKLVFQLGNGEVSIVRMMLRGVLMESDTVDTRSRDAHRRAIQRRHELHATPP